MKNKGQARNKWNCKVQILLQWEGFNCIHSREASFNIHISTQLRFLNIELNAFHLLPFPFRLTRSNWFCMRHSFLTCKNPDVNTTISRLHVSTA